MSRSLKHRSSDPSKNLPHIYGAAGTTTFSSTLRIGAKPEADGLLPVIYMVAQEGVRGNIQYCRAPPEEARLILRFQRRLQKTR